MLLCSLLRLSGLYAESLVHHSTLTAKTFGEVFTLDGKDTLGFNASLSLKLQLALFQGFSLRQRKFCEGNPEHPQLEDLVDCLQNSPTSASMLLGLVPPS